MHLGGAAEGREEEEEMITRTLFATALALAACSSDQCTEIGCASAAIIAGDMGAPTGTVSVQVCRNGGCSTLPTIVPEGCHSGSGEPAIRVCFGPATSGTHVDVTVYGIASELADGDSYSLRVDDDASQTALVDFTATATYTDYWPNGAGCPPACKSVELSL